MLRASSGSSTRPGTSCRGGSLPPSSSSTRCGYLDASRNQLHGWIPPSVFELHTLRPVDLSHNQLSGQLPTTTACADKLLFVDVSVDLLVGSRPACVRFGSSARTVFRSVSAGCRPEAAIASRVAGQSGDLFLPVLGFARNDLSTTA